MTERWTNLGESALSDGASGNEMLPFSWWKEVDWKQTFQYPVVDFFTEVGFYLDTLGFKTAALSEDYALFTTPKEEFAFSFMKTDVGVDLSPFRLQFFTDDLDAILEEIKARGVQTRIFEGSPVQRVIGFTAPSGLPIEVWSGDES